MNSRKIHISALFFFTLFWSFLTTPKIFAENACIIAGGPIQEFSTYQSELNTELSEILAKAKTNAPKDCNPNSQKASFIFDAAQTELVAMQNFMSDFRYNTEYALKWDKSTAVKRDIKIFDQLEKRVEQASESLANSCGFTSENRRQLIDIAKEIYSLKRLYQETAVGASPTNFNGIRTKNYKFAQGITQAYSPSQTASCVPATPSQKSFGDTLKNALNLGAKKEDALSTWRRAIALIRGGGNGMSVTEYTAIQRGLLAAELSRQWLSASAKNVILWNFDCFKSKTLENGNNPDNWLAARVACLSAPIAGAEKVFEMWENFGNTIKSWQNFTWSTPSTDELTTRLREKDRRKTRTFSVIGMHANLNSLVKSDQDDNKTIISNLISWHTSLQATNELLENRIPVMQKNCMKWQPDIVGGCR